MKSILLTKKFTNGIGSGDYTPAPLFPGDFIWYSMHPDTGFITKEDGNRYINDEGNTVMVGEGYGQQDGLMYSGKSITVSGDGVIPVPINYDGSTVQGAVLYFDGTTKQFIQVGSDGVGSNIEHSPDPDFDIGESAWDNVNDGWSFSNGEAIHVGVGDYFHSNALTVGRTYKAIYNVTQADTSNFPQCYMFGLSSAMTTVGIHEFTGVTNDGLISTRGLESCKITSLNVFEILPESATYDLIDGTYGTICVLETNAFSNTDIAFFNEMPERLLQWYFGDITIPSGITRSGGDKIYYPADGVLNELGGVDTINVDGTYTYNVGTTYGVQEMRLEMNGDIPASVIVDYTVAFNGSNSYIDTNVSFDGTLTDFSMMMAFTMPSGNGQVIATSGGEDGVDNKITLRWDGTNSKLEVIIGKNVFDVTPYLNPDEPVHALCAIYDHTTGEVLGAADGADLQSFGTVTFDGQTDEVWIGTNKTKMQPYTGSVGMGLLGAQIYTDAEWKLFWDMIKEPDWFRIDTLDEADILGVWDFGWYRHKTSDDAYRNLLGVLDDFVREAGTPTLRRGEGMNFGGGGMLKSLLPDGIDHNDISVVMQISDTVQNGTLDAFFSHFTDSAHFTLQNGWGSGVLRWSCGDGSSATIEVGSVVIDGVIAVSGRELFVDGSSIGVVPESSAALTANQGFYLGALKLESGSNTQYCRTKVVKLLIVKRQLTADEQTAIYNNIAGSASIGSIGDMDGDGNPDTVVLQHGDIIITEDADSINIDLDGDYVADVEIPK